MATLLGSYSESNRSADQYLNATYAGLAQSFMCNVSGMCIDSAKWFVKKVGSPTGNIVAKLYAHTGTFGSGYPTGTALAVSDNIDVSTFTTTQSLVTFTFSGANRVNLANGTPYCISIEYESGTSSNYVLVGYDLSSPTDPGIGSRRLKGSSSWSTITYDMCFYVYGDTAPPTGELRVTQVMLEVLCSLPATEESPSQPICFVLC